MSTYGVKIGEVARRTGVSVRTLHHYDAIGLLVADRQESDYRYYSDSDIERLYQILALRSLRLSLDQIGEILDAGVDLREVVVKQLDEVDRSLELQQQLRDRLIYALPCVMRRFCATVEA